MGRILHRTVLRMNSFLGRTVLSLLQRNVLRWGNLLERTVWRVWRFYQISVLDHTEENEGINFREMFQI